MLRVIVAGFVTLCSFSFLFFSNVALSVSKQRDFVLIGTGSMMGVYYPMGGGICKFIVAVHDENDSQEKKLICSTASTAGSVYNLNSMRRGTMDVGVAQSDIGYYAYKGENLYNGVPPMKDLRLLAYMHREYLTLIVKRNSGIKTIDDIKGKRINIGAPGTGVRSAMLSLIKVKGWTTKDFLVTSDLKSSEQVQALCDGKIDVVSDFVGHPNAAMQEAVATCDAVALVLDSGLISQLVEKYPYYHEGVVPVGTYMNMQYDIHTISVRASMFATAALSDDMAYLVVKSVASNLSRLRDISGALKDLTLFDLVGESRSGSGRSAVPLHSGAEKFYKDSGLL